jgi:putative transposase
MIRADIRQSVGDYLSSMMDAELTHFLGRGRYERKPGLPSNHRNGSFDRTFALKGVGEVGVKVPRDREGEFKTQVLPRGKRYEDAIKEELCMMFLAGVSTRSLSMLSKKLVGRKLSATEVSRIKRGPESKGVRYCGQSQAQNSPLLTSFLSQAIENATLFL